ncbi:phosphonate ABC transporter permease protein phnE2 [Lachnospiraceae bacterium KM106-2]|nr:phosphonate ABC transporter permease protein phnE2 [Lachnospiraceae bacterium KM106-2]
MKFYVKVFRPHKIQLANGKIVEENVTKAPFFVLLVLAGVYLSVKVTGFQLSVLLERGNEFLVILGQMFPPDMSYLREVWGPLFDTIKMSLLGSVVGAILTIPFAILASSNVISNKVVLYCVRVFLSVVRTVPTLVCALIATYLFGLGTMAGTVAIAVFTFAYVGKQLYEQIETVDMGAFEAMEAMGANRCYAFLGAIFPQILSTYLSVCLFCFEGNVRYASILGFVGAGGLGNVMNEKIGWREYDKVGTMIVLLFFTVMIIETISHYLRKRLA